MKVGLCTCTVLKTSHTEYNVHNYYIMLLNFVAADIYQNSDLECFELVHQLIMKKVSIIYQNILNYCFDVCCNYV